MFGINKGYEAFRNQYKTQNFAVDIKFKLDSQLDYYTVESIYQFAFNKRTENNNFEYIDTWCVRQKENPHITGYETYNILDKRIVYKKKEEAISYDFFQSLFQDTSRNNIYEKIINEVGNYVPPFSNFNRNDAIRYFMDILEVELKEYTRIVYTKVTEYDKKNVKDNPGAPITDLTLVIQNLNSIIEGQKNRILQLEETLNDFKSKKTDITKDKSETVSQFDYGKENISDRSINEVTIKDDPTNQALFNVAATSTKVTIQNIDERKIELGSYKIGKLKDLAGTLKIASLNKFKNNSEDIKKLIALIVEAEAVKE